MAIDRLVQRNFWADAYSRRNVVHKGQPLLDFAAFPFRLRFEHRQPDPAQSSANLDLIRLRSVELQIGRDLYKQNIKASLAGFHARKLMFHRPVDQTVVLGRRQERPGRKFGSRWLSSLVLLTLKIGSHCASQIAIENCTHFLNI